MYEKKDMYEKDMYEKELNWNKFKSISPILFILPRVYKCAEIFFLTFIVNLVKRNCKKLQKSYIKKIKNT